MCHEPGAGLSTEVRKLPLQSSTKILHDELHDKRNVWVFETHKRTSKLRFGREKGKDSEENFLGEMLSKC